MPISINEVYGIMLILIEVIGKVVSLDRLCLIKLKG
jgi:hypothetical protein